MKPSELIARHRADWDGAVHHSFLDGVREGSLPRPAFDLWLQQDYLFVANLLEFQARLLAIAPRRGQGPLAAGLVGLVSELGWFEEQAGARGLGLDIEPKPQTKAYRAALRNLLERGFEPAMTALWALERIYLEAWRNARSGAPEYRAFVDHWTPDDFARYVEDLEAVAGGGDDAEAAFVEICRLEREFWEMAWSGH